MCNPSCIVFGVNHLSHEVINKRVLEMGSRNVNGSLRSVLANLAHEWLGIDIVWGTGVDLLLPAEKAVDEFGPNSFDVVISTEMLEHVCDWRAVISSMKNVVKPEGIILLTTRSRGYPFHEFPHDSWRWEVSDIENIFCDCEVLCLESDPFSPGVFAKIRKPKIFVEAVFPYYKLYSMATGRREAGVPQYRGLRKVYLLLRYKYATQLRIKSAMA